MITLLLILIVLALHLYFMVLEIFLWTRPSGLKTFGNTPEFAQSTAALAQNMGLYNGFLAAGLGWSVLDSANGWPVAVFFLSCVIVAGAFGAVTVSRRIFFVQALPAILALLALLTGL